MRKLLSQKYAGVHWLLIGMLLSCIFIGMLMCSHFAASVTTVHLPAVNCVQAADDCMVFNKEGSAILLGAMALLFTSLLFRPQILLLYSGYGGLFVRQVIQACNNGAKLNNYLVMALASGILHPKTY